MKELDNYWIASKIYWKIRNLVDELQHETWIRSLKDDSTGYGPDNTSAWFATQHRNFQSWKPIMSLSLLPTHFLGEEIPWVSLWSSSIIWCRDANMSLSYQHGAPNCQKGPNKLHNTFFRHMNWIQQHSILCHAQRFCNHDKIVMAPCETKTLAYRLILRHHWLMVESRFMAEPSIIVTSLPAHWQGPAKRMLLPCQPIVRVRPKGCYFLASPLAGSGQKEKVAMVGQKEQVLPCSPTFASTLPTISMVLVDKNRRKLSNLKLGGPWHP
jgi:hypothetical protein